MSTEPQQPRRLYRSIHNRMIAGVCGGIAEYLNVDPTLVRLGFALLTLASGSGLLLYIIMAIIMPRAPAGAYPATGPAIQLNLGAAILLLVGVALVAFGALSALEQVAPWLSPYSYWSFRNLIGLFGKFFWASLIVVVGLIIIASALRKR